MQSGNKEEKGKGRFEGRSLVVCLLGFLLFLAR